MSNLRLPGLATGIDTAALVKQLMAIERRTLNKFMVRKETWDERRTVLDELKGKLETLQSAAAALSDARQLRAYNTTSSNTDLLTAESSDKAFEGNHTVIIDQLANVDRWVHSTGSKYAADYVGAGTFIYKYNQREVIINTTAETTLEDFVGLINNDPNNPGLTANLLHYNGAYHLVLNGNDAGSDYQIGVNSSSTEVWQATSAFTLGGADAALATRIANLDQFSGTFAGDESITISGQQNDGTAVSHVFSINEHMKLEHLIEEINEAFGGTATATLIHGEIRLTDHTNGASQMQLGLTYNAGSGSTTFDIPAISQSREGGSVTATLAGYAEGDFTVTQTAQDSRIKVNGFPPGEAEWISRSSNTIDNVLQGVTLHLHDTGAVQVSLTRDIESVKGKLKTLIDAYNAVVSFIGQKTAYDEETKTGGILMGDATVRSINNDLRMPLIRQVSGFVRDIDSFFMPAEIGLELDGDGLLNLDNTVFDEAIAKDYMGVLSVIGAAKTGSSTSNSVQFYGASSRYTRGGTYDVEVTVSGGAITGARIKLASESTYRDATFGENIVVGDGGFSDQGDPLYPENGLQLSVDLSRDGTFTATVRVKQGFAGAMEDRINTFVKATNGWLTLDQASITTQIRNLEERIQREEDRLVRTEQRLVARYARLERTLTLLQNQMAALDMM